jgi:hypothetical protein
MNRDQLESRVGSVVATLYDLLMAFVRACMRWANVLRFGLVIAYAAFIGVVVKALVRHLVWGFERPVFAVAFGIASWLLFAAAMLVHIRSKERRPTVHWLFVVSFALIVAALWITPSAAKPWGSTLAFAWWSWAFFPREKARALGGKSARRP